MSQDLYTQLRIEDKEDAMLEISGEIAWAQLEKYYETSLQKTAEQIEIDGFRKGKAPHEAVESHVGQMSILQEAAQAALGDVYPAIVLEKKLKVLGYPQISITKIGHGSELGFTITTAVIPEVTLSDYKKIAAKHNKEEIKIEVSEQELEESIDRMRNMYAHSMGSEQKKGDPDVEHDLPELTDEFVGKLGDYKTVKEFREKFTEELRSHKEIEEQGKRRENMVLEISKDSSFEVPAVMVEAEIDKMLGAMREDVSRMGLEYDKWLEHSGKTEEDMRTEMKDDARDRARADVVLKEISLAEKLVPDQDKINEQVAKIQEAHPDAPEENIRAYVENIYINETVLEFLEKQ